MSYVCKHGYKCMCFKCPEKDCEHYESEPPEWVKNIAENLDNIPTIEERKSTIEFPHVFIAEGYDSIKSEDGETGFGVYDPENKQIFIAGAVPDEVFIKTLLHELMHWVQDISGYAFNEDEANTFAENIYNTMESYIVTNRWIPIDDSDELRKIWTEYFNGIPSAQPYTEEQIQKMQDLEQAQLEEAYRRGRESAQPKIGKWVYGSPVTVKCNQCGFYIPDWEAHSSRFCRNCGAKMEG